VLMCVGCPISDKYGDKPRMIVRLEHGGRVFGVLSVSMPLDLVHSEQEHSVFEEVAGDIAFALYSMELEEERVRAEEALRESEERLRSVLQTANDAIIVADAQGRITMSNAAAEAMFGYSVDELRDKPLDALMPERLRKARRQTLQRLVAAGRKIPCRIIETIGLRRDGSEFPVEFSLACARAGGEAFVTVVIRDISERKLAEAELRRLKEFSEGIIEGMAEALLMEDDQGIITFANPAAEELLGYTVEELVGCSWQQLVPQDEIQRVQTKLTQRPLGVSERYETRLLHKDGHEIAVIVSARPLFKDDKFTGVLSAFTDITERKCAEAELRKRNKELQLLYEAGRQLGRSLDLQEVYDTLYQLICCAMDCDGIYISSYDAQSKLIRCVYARHGTKRIDHSRFPPIPLEPEGHGIQSEVIRSGRPLLVRDFQARMKKTQTRYYVGVENGTVSKVDREPERQTRSALLVPLKLEQQVVGVIQVFSEKLDAYSEDDLRLLEGLALQAVPACRNALLYQQAQKEIAQRKQAEKELQESRQLLRLVLDTAPGHILLLDREGHYILVNKACAEFYQTTPQEMVGKTAHYLVEKGYLQPELVEEFKRENAQVVDQGLIYQSRERAVTLPDGTVYWFETTKVPLTLPDGRRYVLVVAMDVTERKRAEEERGQLEAQLRLAQKMEAVGLLAGGVAHEFNNLLTVIQGSTELAMRQLEKGSPLQQELSIVQRTARRAAKLTRQLLAYSRRQILTPQAMDLNEVISDLTKMLRRVIGEDIELQLKLTKLEPIYADSGAIEQVLMNLAVNARDAMPEGGILRIETAQVTVDEEYSHTHAEARLGKYVRLRVADTGIGMSEAIQQHLFEPFFTTKEVGKGTGLGLAVVYGIVKQHDGWIEVQSELGKGTCFDIYLPLYKPGPEAARAEAVEEQGLVGGVETVLLAEDEEGVREFIERSLSGLGYKVLSASDGQEAVELFKQNYKGIDLLILDAVMPKLSGRKAYQAMCELRNGVPVLYITGYSADLVGEDLVSETGVGVLQKPFSIGELGRKVRQLLDE